MAVNINVPSQVRTFANLAAFPATGALKTIYIAEDTNKTYRWTGSVYTEISASAAMTWGAIGGTLSNQTDLQSALDAKVPTSRTLTINGVTQDLSANRTFTISTGITIGTTAITSGTVGRILFEGAGNVVQESSSLFWDNTNARLGIGTSSPARALDIVKTIASGAIEGIKIEVNHSSSTSAGILDFVHTQFDARFRIQSIAGAAGANPTLSFIVRSTTAMSILQSGNVNIGSSTIDAGFRLDVNGTARVQSTLTASSGLTISAGTFNITTTTNLYARNNNFYINSFVPSGGTISGIILSPSSGSFTNTGAGGTSRGDLFVSATNIATSVGNVTLNHFVVQNDINNTAATSLIRGFYYNPTLTSVVGTTHYAFHSTSGLVRFENLPTSSAGLPAGTLYNNLGVLMIA